MSGPFIAYTRSSDPRERVLCSDRPRGSTSSLPESRDGPCHIDRQKKVRLVGKPASRERIQMSFVEKHEDGRSFPRRVRKVRSRSSCAAPAPGPCRGREPWTIVASKASTPCRRSPATTPGEEEEEEEEERARPRPGPPLPGCCAAASGRHLSIAL